MLHLNGKCVKLRSPCMKHYIYYKLVDVRCPVVNDRTYSEYGRA